MAIVIGMNGPKSLDSSINREFVGAIATPIAVKGIAYRFFGFQWEPLLGRLSQYNSTLLYQPEQAYLLFKCLSPTQAPAVLEVVEEIVSPAKFLFDKLERE